MFVEVDTENQILKIKQEITYHNQTADTLKEFILNDWNNAYSGKETPLAKRFSDEYVRAFHLANDSDRGFTTIYSIIDQNNLNLNWDRPARHPDLVEVKLKNPIYPNQKFKLTLTYQVKIPNERFTKFGYDDKTLSFNLRDWYLAPARVVNNKFVRYSNENLDDIANAVADYEITLTVPKGTVITTDLDDGKLQNETAEQYLLKGKNRMGFTLALETKNTFEVYSNSYGEVSCNIKDSRVTEIQKAYLINQVTEFTSNTLGGYPFKKIMVTQADYERSPMYGLNQLPAFLNPYP